MLNRGWLTLPGIVLIMIVGLLPTFVIINYSFQMPYAPENKFVGFLHFQNSFYDTRWFEVWGRTLLLSSLILAIEVPLGIGLALLVYKKGRFNSLITASVVMPALFPGVTIGLIWRLMTFEVGPLNGLLNSILNPLGITYSPFVDPTQAFLTILGMDVWHWVSLIFIVVLASLASMETAPRLAAKTDGANRWQIFRYVELPKLKFPLVFVVLIRLIDSLKIYDEAVILTGGGPGLTTEFLSLYIKKIGIDQWLLGYGSALSLIYLLIILLLTNVLVNFLTKGKGLL